MERKKGNNISNITIQLPNRHIRCVQCTCNGIVGILIFTQYNFFFSTNVLPISLQTIRFRCHCHKFIFIMQRTAMLLGFAEFHCCIISHFQRDVGIILRSHFTRRKTIFVSAVNKVLNWIVLTYTWRYFKKRHPPSIARFLFYQHVKYFDFIEMPIFQFEKLKAQLTQTIDEKADWMIKKRCEWSMVSSLLLLLLLFRLSLPAKNAKHLMCNWISAAPKKAPTRGNGKC